jgi:hypothetical protein
MPLLRFFELFNDKTESFVREHASVKAKVDRPFFCADTFTH